MTSREELAKLVKASAELCWAKMDDNQKTAVRIGMFPAELMREFDTYPSPMLAVALMDIATNNGGMIV